MLNENAGIFQPNLNILVSPAQSFQNKIYFVKFKSLKDEEMGLRLKKTQIIL